MNDSPIDLEKLYPCRIDVKIFVRHLHDLSWESVIRELAMEYFGQKDVLNISSRFSSQKSYMAITCSLMVHRREQADDFYRRLTSHEQIVMVI